MLIPWWGWLAVFLYLEIAFLVFLRISSLLYKERHLLRVRWASALRVAVFDSLLWFVLIQVAGVRELWRDLQPTEELDE